ncbi:MAG: hypothetical protein KKA84_02330 [Bacteroidetes bacterium]|nr:hypothetical protein [Bacteroidota bacterium]
MYCILFYEFVDGYLEKRIPYRQEHLNLVHEYIERDLLRLGGAFANPADSAALVFFAEDMSVVESFVKVDPYYTNALVKKYTIREWTVVVGKDMIGDQLTKV